MTHFTLIELEELRLLLSEVVKEQLQSQSDHNPGPFDNYPDLLTRAQAAQLLNVSLASIDNWAASGRLKKLRIETAIRFKKEEILASLNDLQRYNRNMSVSHQD